MSGHSGGCQCGAVRYHVEGEMEYGHICHCRMCQKATGNYFMPLARARMDGFTFTRGAPSWFQSSGAVRRGFCAACGTPLFFDIPGRDVISIALGSLDHPAAVPVGFQSGTEARLPFFADLAALPENPSSADWYETVAQAVFQHPDHDTEHWPETGLSQEHGS